jgi:hypothetical protein
MGIDDLSGRYAYVGDSGDVVDTSALEVDWMNGAPSITSTRFGLGRVTK